MRTEKVKGLIINPGKLHKENPAGDRPLWTPLLSGYLFWPQKGKNIVGVWVLKRLGFCPCCDLGRYFDCVDGDSSRVFVYVAALAVARLDVLMSIDVGHPPVICVFLAALFKKNTMG